MRRCEGSSSRYRRGLIPQTFDFNNISSMYAGARLLLRRRPHVEARLWYGVSYSVQSSSRVRLRITMLGRRQKRCLSPGSTSTIEPSISQFLCHSGGSSAICAATLKTLTGEDKRDCRQPSRSSFAYLSNHQRLSSYLKKRKAQPDPKYLNRRLPSQVMPQKHLTLFLHRNFIRAGTLSSRVSNSA